ncbi:MAG: uracil-DNA glycosylase family protein, partial [bacterium]
MADSLPKLESEVTHCGRCTRLVEWREQVAADPPKRYRGDVYWARPVPGFGDVSARIVVLGLAPGANGSNRTGRMFTGDRS